MSSLQVLISLIVGKVEKVHDYIQIIFSDDTTLSIFNNYVYDGGPVLGIEGKKVKSIDESSDGILIIFDDGRSISVGLKDKDFNGPEAMVLRKNGRETIVWS